MLKRGVFQKFQDAFLFLNSLTQVFRHAALDQSAAQKRQVCWHNYVNVHLRQYAKLLRAINIKQAFSYTDSLNRDVIVPFKPTLCYHNNKIIQITFTTMHISIYRCIMRAQFLKTAESDVNVKR